MNVRLTGILALVAALLALLIAFWDRDDTDERQRLEQARRAFRFDAERVDRLVIQSAQLTLECHRQAGRWHLRHPISARADSVAIERLLGALQELPRGNIILPPRRAEHPYAPYGLDEPRASIAIIEGVTTNWILIGRRTPLGDGVYVRQSDHPGLARVSTSVIDLLPASPETLRDRSLLTGAPAAIHRLDIRGPSGFIQLARDARGQWRLFQPFSARADSAAVSGLIEQLLACSIVQFVQDGVSDLAPYGLDPQAAITALLNADSGEGSQMLAFGDPLPNAPTLVFARLQAEPSVYAVPQSVRQALLIRPEDLRDRHIPGLAAEGIRTFRIEQGEQVLELARDGAGGWEILEPLRAPAEAHAVEALLQSWSAVRLVAFESATPDPQPPATRVLHIERQDARLPPVILRLSPMPDQPDRVRTEIDGDSAVSISSPARLLEFPIDPLLYRSRDIFSIPTNDIASIQVQYNHSSIRADRDPATGQWTPAEPWIARLMEAMTPLRAEQLLPSGAESADDGFASPYLTVTLRLQGQSGLAVTLVVGSEHSPGGNRNAMLRGRDLRFTLSPQTVEALHPPDTGAVVE